MSTTRKRAQKRKCNSEPKRASKLVSRAGGTPIYYGNDTYIHQEERERWNLLPVQAPTAGASVVNGDGSIRGVVTGPGIDVSTTATDVELTLDLTSLGSGESVLGATQGTVKSFSTNTTGIDLTSDASNVSFGLHHSSLGRDRKSVV